MHIEAEVSQHGSFEVHDQLGPGGANRNLEAVSRFFHGDGATVPYRVILCYLPYNAITPWVVWLQDHTGFTFHGQYCAERKEAKKQFEDRCKSHSLAIAYRLW